MLASPTFFLACSPLCARLRLIPLVASDPAPSLALALLGLEKGPPPISTIGSPLSFGSAAESSLSSSATSAFCSPLVPQFRNSHSEYTLTTWWINFAARSSSSGVSFGGNCGNRVSLRMFVQSLRCRMNCSRFSGDVCFSCNRSMYGISFRSGSRYSLWISDNFSQNSSSFDLASSLAATSRTAPGSLCEPISGAICCLLYSRVCVCCTCC
mmetsp:Transcript_10669/g.22637  ORF Transcript_10669/g.22637 Transcript_10669/m.22637 type:complete len:211 (-) Transcript_10669:203-835(-)